MIYNLFRFWANIAIRVFYGKIEVSGIANIPKGVPLLIASNHPNGFLEPIIMACLFPRPLHFMVRGDVFNMKWLKPILEATNQIPIFRFKDGFTDLRKNDSNLQQAYRALDKEAAIILFIEGGTINIKKLRPFQKGLGRMASDYLDREESRQDLTILPVAINFVSPFVLRSRVVLNIGQPLEAKEYFTDSLSKPTQIKHLTDDLYKQVKPLAFHVSKDDRQPILNKALKLAEGFFPLSFFPMVSYKPKLWQTFKSISNTIDGFDKSEYIDFVKGLNQLGEIKEDDVKRLTQWPILNFFLSVLLLFPALLGFIVNIVPGLLAQMFSKKVLKGDNMVFKASITLCAGVAFYVVYYFFVIVVLSFFYGFKSLLFLLAWPLGFIYLLWKNVFRSTFLKRKYQLTKIQKDGLISLFSRYNITLPKIQSL